MLFLYQIISRLYNGSIHLAGLFGHRKARIIVFERKKQRQEWTDFNPGIRPIWIHCASAGEFEQAIPVVRKLKEKLGLPLLATFFSPSGCFFHKDNPLIDHIFLLPAENKSNAHSFIQKVNPALAIWVKNEFWYQYLQELYSKNIPVYWLNNNLDFEKNLLNRFIYKNLYFFRKVFSIRRESGKIADNIIETGDTKWERSYDISSEPFKNEVLEKFSKDHFTIVLGSCWEQEANLVSTFFKDQPQFSNQTRWIILPHELDKENISKLAAQLPGSVTQVTDLENTSDISEATRFLVITRKGILKYIYRYADLAIVGGGFGKGTHNILEAAVYGIPVFFGPNYKKFPENPELINSGQGTVIKDYIQFEKALINQLTTEKTVYPKLHTEGTSEWIVKMILEDLTLKK